LHFDVKFVSCQETLLHVMTFAWYHCTTD